MKTGKKVASVFFGCAVLLFANHYVSADSMTSTSSGVKPPTVTIVSGGELKGKEFSFTLRGSAGNVICSGANIRLGLAAAPIVCPNLLNIQQDTLKITMGPETTTKCALTTPMEFLYKKGRNVIINPISLSQCRVEAN